MKIGTFEAKTHFSEIIKAVQSGKDYTITKRGKPVALISPYNSSNNLRKNIVKRLSSYRNINSEPLNIKKAIEEGQR
jgi:prevent-host-death family protein